MQWFGYPYPSGHAAGWHRLSLGSLYNKGVLLVLYINYVIAVDSWNGTVLWEKDTSGSLRFNPGGEGGPGCMDDNYFYLTFDEECHAIDLKDGRDVKTLTLPNKGDWGFIATYEKYLIGSSQDPKASDKGKQSQRENTSSFWHRHKSGRTVVTSDTLTVKDKASGKDIATYSNPGHSIVNSTITIAEGKVYFVEITLPTGRHMLKKIANSSPQLVALNLSDMTMAWPKKKEFTAKFEHVLYLAFSKGYLYATSNTGLNPEKGKPYEMFYNFQKIDAANGSVVWDVQLKSEKTPSHSRDISNAIITKDYIWAVATASNHIAIYRSTAIGYTNFDTGEMGFASQVNRPSCWMSQIPAGGVIMMPEGSFGCVCTLPYQGSIVLAPK